MRSKQAVTCHLTVDNICVVIEGLCTTSSRLLSQASRFGRSEKLLFVTNVTIFVGLMFFIMTVAVSLACELNAERKENPRCLKMGSESSPVSSAPRPAEYGRPATPLLASLWPAQPWRVAERPYSLPIHSYFSTEEAKFGQKNIYISCLRNLGSMTNTNYHPLSVWKLG